MVANKNYYMFLIAVLSGILSFNGCQRDLDVLSPVTYPTDAEIYIDGFGPPVQFQSFGDAKLDALSISTTEKYSGTSSLQITVPSSGSSYGSYAGGAFVSTSGRDLRGYNAITFWAKSSIEAILSVAGMGNDNTGNSKFLAQKSGMKLHTIWTKYIIPIPDAQKLTHEKGLFFFAVANMNGSGFNVWFDDVKYEYLGTIAHTRVTMATKSVTKIAGDTLHLDGISPIFNVDGVDDTVQASSSFLTCATSDSSVAVVDEYSVVTAVGAGTANITAKLGSTSASGVVTVTSTANVGPATVASLPSIDTTAKKVVSLFCSAFKNSTVDSWAASWGTGKVKDTTVAGRNVKLYSNLGFAGIDFTYHQINATDLTHLHMDLWTVYPTTSASFKVKLVDFGPDGIAGTGDDAQQELSFTKSTTPSIATGAWVSLDIPLDNFVLAHRANLAQIIISGDLKTVWLDNIYFYQGTVTGPTVPKSAPSRPTVAAANVISLLSNAYTNISMDTWAAPWQYSTSVVADKTIGADNVKYYTNLNFAGILPSSSIDATSMTHFHIDIWTPNTIGASTFKVLLYDFGADGAYGGGDDAQQELIFTASSTPALVSGAWVSYDIPLTSFTGLTHRAHLAQIVISGGLTTLWVDNVYFYKSTSSSSSAPTTAAPTPSYAAANVVSLYSGAYTNVPVDTWAATWQSATLKDTVAAGDSVKHYSSVSFTGTEFIKHTVDASSMTYFHFDLWTPSTISISSAFKVKLVDFGANGAYGGGDDVEHELTFTITSSPALAKGTWISFDIPLSNFSGLVTRAHLAQLIFSGLDNFYLDNVLFHK